MKKLAIVTAIAVIAIAFCAYYINRPDQAAGPIEEAQDVPTRVVRVQDIVETPEQTKNTNTYGGIAYDFENTNPIKTK